MSAKSKPSTAFQAELSKISETSSRALMRSNLARPVSRPSAAESQAAGDGLGHLSQRAGRAFDRVVHQAADLLAEAGLLGLGIGGRVAAAVRPTVVRAAAGRSTTGR